MCGLSRARLASPPHPCTAQLSALGSIVTVKDQAIAAIRRLPDEAEIRDIEEEIAFLHAIGEAEADITAGAVISNSEMLSRLKGWTSN